MRVGPRQLQDVGEEALGEAVTAHDLLGELGAFGCQRDVGAEEHQTIGFHAFDHL